MFLEEFRDDCGRDVFDTGDVGEALEHEAALIAGFVAGGSAAEMALVDELRPMIRKEVEKYWPRLLGQLDDLEQEAFLKLFRLRDKAKEKILPPFLALVKQLLNTETLKITRDRRRLTGKLPELSVAPAQEASAEIDRLLQLACTLPDDQGRVLKTYTNHLTGVGPEVHVALEIGEAAARLRLRRAQFAVARLVRAEVANV